MDLGAHVQRVFHRELLLCDKQLRRKEAFVDGDIRAFRMLQPPLVRISVAGVGELEAVPVEDEADRPIESMNGRHSLDDNAVLLVDDLIHALVVELGNLELLALRVHVAKARGRVPGQHLFHMRDRIGRSVFFLGAVRPPNAQGYLTVRNDPAHPKITEITEMVAMQMPDENLIEVVERNR